MVEFNNFMESMHATEQTQKLQELVASLEEEKLKIHPFKHEFPLCMQLLTNAMEASRQELELQLGEFIPVKNTTSSSNISGDKAKWMASARLWSQETDEETQSPLVTSDAMNANQKRGAFRRFLSEEYSSSSPNAAFPESGLASCHKGEIEDSQNSLETVSRKENFGKCCTADQSHRKPRRCWSPDLHTRFVNALRVLGGSQVATPKQIRELMKVDGLTNDEVKSHLQKYRLHTRSPSPQNTVTGELVVLGGIPEYAAAAAHGGVLAAAFYGGPHAAAAALKVSAALSNSNGNMFFHAT